MLVDLYPPVIGGVERHVESLSAELVRSGHQVTVVTLGSPDSAEDESGVKVYRLGGIFQRIPFLYGGSKKKWHPPAPDWLLTRKLSLIIEQESPDIIHAHGWILYSVLPLKKRIGIPKVTTLHGYGYFCPRSTLMKQDSLCRGPSILNCLGCVQGSYGIIRALAAYCGVGVNRGRLKLVDKFIAFSSFVKAAHMRYLGLRDRDIVTIPNFYNPDVSVGEGTAESLPGDFILFVGALAPHKGVDALIEAYCQINTETKLVVIGYRHQDYHYESTENILVLENAPHDVIMQAMAKCRFVVIPSQWPDPAPTVAYEAMSQRRAIIATNIGGLGDIVVDGETGILVPPGDLSRLGGAILRLLQSPETAQAIGERGYERFIDNYTAAVVIPRIINVYEGLLARVE